MQEHVSMRILYSHDVRNGTVWAVLTGRIVRWITTSDRHEPEDWEVDALKDGKPVENVVTLGSYYGVIDRSEASVACRVREPAGKDPKGKYELDECRLLIRGPESIIVMPMPADEDAWRDAFLHVYTTTLDAAIFNPGRRSALILAHKKLQKRFTKRRAERLENRKNRTSDLVPTTKKKASKRRVQK